MIYVFVSNFFNHHQSPFSAAMNALTGGRYYFIETQAMSDERKGMGWVMTDYPGYVKRFYESSDSRRFCMELIDSADVVIIGSAPESVIKNRLRSGKLTFRYSERIYKSVYEWYKFPKRLVSFYFKSGRYKNLYLLCASAYTAADYAKTFTFLNKTYKWGYFPEIKHYTDVEGLMDQKKHASILWAGRLIEWKHADASILAAKKLRESGYKFELNIIGNGILEDNLKQLIRSEGLNDCVHMLGSMTPTEVRQHMEQSEIFLFTSDRNEGWGAVMNESMNSGCAVVASHAIGSVPFLVNDKENGLIYKNGNNNDLYNKVKGLLDNPNQRKEMGKKAISTMTEQWNAENAAKRLLSLCEQLLSGEKHPCPFQDGVCSKAEILSDKWY